MRDLTDDEVAAIRAEAEREPRKEVNLMPPGLEAKNPKVVNPELKRWIAELRERLFAKKG
jgi:hypothetical protein